MKGHPYHPKKGESLLLDFAAFGPAIFAVFYSFSYPAMIIGTSVVLNILTLILTMLPWLALCIIYRSDGKYTLGSSSRFKQSPTDLVALFFMPGIGLTSLVLANMHALQPLYALVIAITGGVIMTTIAAYIIYIVDPAITEKWPFFSRYWIILALFMSAYGFGAGMLINVLLDHSAPQFFQTTVKTKHYYSRSQEAILAAWGPEHKETAESSPMAARLKTGDLICIKMGAGALGITWYETALCNPG